MIQRYSLGHHPIMGIGIIPRSNGDFVRYEDHLKAVAAAVAEGVKAGRAGARADDATALWRYFKDECGPITGKGMTAGPVCVDEAVAVVEGTKP